MERKNILVRPMTWHIAFEAAFLFEIEKDKITSLLPSYTQPVEIRPNICLLGIGCQIFKPGNLDLPAFKEVYCYLPTAPELRYSMPLPSFASYVINICSENMEFLENAQRLDKMPIYQSNSVDIDIDPYNHTLFAKDDEDPIIEVQVSEEARAKKFYPKKLWSQQICEMTDGFYIGAAVWDGMVYEYQKNISIGKLYCHPFFKGLDVNGLGDNCHTQMFTPSEGSCTLTFYQPFFYRS